MRLRVLQSGLMSLFLVTLMTVWITFLNLGFTNHFFFDWGRAFLLAWPVAFLIAFFTGPMAAKLAHKIDSKLSNK